MRKLMIRQVHLDTGICLLYDVFIKGEYEFISKGVSVG